MLTAARGRCVLPLLFAALAAASGQNALSLRAYAQQLEPGSGEPRFEIVSLQRVPRTCPFLDLTSACDERPPLRPLPLVAGTRIEFPSYTGFELVRIAYGVEGLPPEFVQGGPGWLQSQRYDVIGVAATDGLATAGRSRGLTPEVRAMLRNFLADRFALRVRTEQKDRNVLRLTRLRPDRLGPGLTPARGVCPDQPPGMYRVAIDGITCAFESSSRLVAWGITSDELGRLLTRRLGTLVVDETGLTGEFDVSLDWQPGPGVFEHAVRNGLGLALQHGRRAMDTVTIVSAERPLEE